MESLRTVLLTGVSGFIGSHLATRLNQHGYRVIGIYSGRSELFRLSSLPPSITLRQVDLRNSNETARIFEEYRFDFVFHLAAYGVGSKDDDLADMVLVNVLGSTTLARLSLRHGVSKFIYVGSGFEYAPQSVPMSESAPLRPYNSYGASKLATWTILDYLCRSENLPLVTFRPFSVYGPAEDPRRLFPYVILRALKNVPIKLTLGTQIRDYLYVDDVVNALILGCEVECGPGQVFNIGAGSQGALLIRDVVNCLLNAVGDVSADRVQFGAVERKRAEPEYFVADTSHARDYLGWQITVPFERGVLSTIEWYRGQGPCCET